MPIRPYASQDQQQILDLTLATFGPFYEDSFRPLMGEVIFAVQHFDWRESYAQEVPPLHQPEAGKYVDVAEIDGAVAGYISWQINPAREHGMINILAVAPQHRRDQLARIFHRFSVVRVSAG